MKTVGYIILIEAKATQDKTSEAMSYGYPNETDSEMLLRRGRATLFESYEEAEQALKETLLAATAQNSKWPEKFIYKIVPVEVTAPQRKPDQEPVAWVGLDLDNMAEAFYRVIEEHHSRKYPFHDPVNRDAMLALRELRGLIAYMKRNTTPPQREWVGLTEEDKNNCLVSADPCECLAKPESHQLIEDVEAKLREKNTC